MLDVSIRIGILNLMIKLKEERDIAFLYVTHDLASARYLADDILVMYAGQIVERGPVEQVLAEPLHPYTKLLLAAVHGERIVDRGVGGGAAAVDPGAGCRFVDRCPLAIRHVLRDEPGARRDGGGPCRPLLRHCAVADLNLSREDDPHDRADTLSSFPADFIWGAATASYQIEGAVRRGRPRRERVGSLLRDARQGPRRRHR